MFLHVWRSPKFREEWSMLRSDCQNPIFILVSCRYEVASSTRGSAVCCTATRTIEGQLIVESVSARRDPEDSLRPGRAASLPNQAGDMGIWTGPKMVCIFRLEKTHKPLSFGNFRPNTCLALVPSPPCASGSLAGPRLLRKSPLGMA